MQNAPYRRTKEKKRYRAVLASVILHLLFALIIGLMLSEQRAINEDTFDAAFFTLNPLREQLRPTRKTVSSHATPVPDTLRTQASPPLSPISQLPRSDAPPVARQDATLTFDPDVLTPTDVAVPSVAPAQRGAESTALSSVKAEPTSPGVSVMREGFVTPTPNPPTHTSSTGLTEFLDGTLHSDGLGKDFARALRSGVTVPKGQLGGILEGTGQEFRGHIRLIRLKHSLSDWWQDPTAIPALIKWLEKYTQIRADMNFEGGALPLTDARILDAPLIVMTGHDKDITVGRGLAKDGPLSTGFTEAERAALRKYIVERGGMLFFDDCGFNGLFAHIVADELKQIFPEYPLEILPHDHEIYRIYYHLPKPPTGGDVFWGNENNAQPTQFRYQKGITIGKRLAVVYNRKDYMCAMETAEIESRTMLRLRRSTDVYRFMSNLLIYALKYGGNIDRAGYRE